MTRQTKTLPQICHLLLLLSNVEITKVRVITIDVIFNYAVYNLYIQEEEEEEKNVSKVINWQPHENSVVQNEEFEADFPVAPTWLLINSPMITLIHFPFL